MKENNTCERCGKKNPAEIHTCTPGYYFEKENNTGQTVYEQLQEFLNECVKLGRLNKIFYKGVFVLEDGVYRDQGRVPMFSFHDLFSKDSGIMERVEWENKDYLHLNVNWGREDAEDGFFGLDAKYMLMGPLTAEEKVKYFLSNATIGSKSQL